MSTMALLAAARPTEVPKGPFVAFQQGKDALPDGRRVSNWYLLDDGGNSVRRLEAHIRLCVNDTLLRVHRHHRLVLALLRMPVAELA